LADYLFDFSSVYCKLGGSKLKLTNMNKLQT